MISRSQMPRELYNKGTMPARNKKNYPKCVPIAKARAMSKGQRAGAVKRKQAKANTGPTPSRAATFAKRKKAMGGGMIKPMYGKGGGVCIRGMNRQAVGKNS